MAMPHCAPHLSTFVLQSPNARIAQTNFCERMFSFFEKGIKPRFAKRLGLAIPVQWCICAEWTCEVADEVIDSIHVAIDKCDI